ncbi:hypothetical protein RHODGE_RHODGE_01723 [Rhodoplanes serenus]|uniref:Uncharacterized protein n=2 Tax=Nitrobacteraceae TaxID=41294 RepID=A0A3S4BFD4_9BRAD|nr:hypothetical protein RHODGE_RHODGE_01723 [Rhodoplanes serenus]
MRDAGHQGGHHGMGTAVARAGVVRAGLLWAGVMAAMGLSAPAAMAQQGCCGPGPVIVYGAVAPPIGYVLDPAGARPPIYVVNQGPVYRGAGVYAVPTFSEGGDAYAHRYPYTYGPVYAPVGPYRRPYAYPPRRYGYLGPGAKVGAKVIDVRRVASVDQPGPTVPSR